MAESVLVKQQLLILNRSRHRAPNLCASDRILAGVCALFMRPARVIRSAIVLRPSTILEFHRALRTRKYRWLLILADLIRGQGGGPRVAAEEGGEMVCSCSATSARPVAACAAIAGRFVPVGPVREPRRTDGRCPAPTAPKRRADAGGTPLRGAASYEAER